MIFSNEEEITRLPSGLSAKDSIGLLCPLKTWMQSPLLLSHILIVLSMEPETTRELSMLIESDVIPFS